MGGGEMVSSVTALGRDAASAYSDGYSLSVENSGDIVFSGRGWGHGVGMSQRGAEGLARQGYDFRRILHHYYTGVVITE